MDRWKTRIIFIVAICFVLILLLMTADFVSKHLLYLQQREVLYTLIQDGLEYDHVKATVSYLQGTATRRLTQIQETAIYFGLSFFVFYLLIQRIDKGGKQ